MKRAKIFTIKFDPITEKFNDSEFQQFINDKEILEINDHFFTKADTPYIVLTVVYKLLETYPKMSVLDTKKEDKNEDWKKELAEKDYPLFNSLKDWRKKIAKDDGRPAYIICHNKQLAEIATKRPSSLAGLAQIYGFGDNKVKKYGEDILKIVAVDHTNKPDNQSLKKDEKTNIKKSENLKQENLIFNNNSSNQENINNVKK